MELEHFNLIKEKARAIFFSQKNLYNPYFNCAVIFNSDGFHHLQFSARQERSKKEQILKFSLLPLAIKVIKKAGTLQEYRKGLITIGKKDKDGFSKVKNIEYWAFIAIMGDLQIKIRVILRRIGDGNITF